MENMEWEIFNLKDLFSVTKGTRLVVSERIKGDIPFATAGHENQGISDFISNDLEIFENVITIDMFSEAFYRNYPFCCDDNVHVLIPKEPMNKYVSLFIVSVINSSKHILNYGKQYRLKTFERHKILLPINDDGEPNYEFMESFMRVQEEELIRKYCNYLNSRLSPEMRERERERA